jgi:hypothetical protein
MYRSSSIPSSPMACENTSCVCCSEDRGCTFHQLVEEEEEDVVVVGLGLGGILLLLLEDDPLPYMGTS